MLVHEQYRLVILKQAVTMTRGGDETIGWQTNRTMLNVLLSEAGLDGSGRAPEDALLQLRNQKRIALHKVLSTPPHLGYYLDDFSAYSSASIFFSGPFNIRVLPEGTAYLSELEGKQAADLRSSRMVKLQRFDVGSHVLVGREFRLGQVTQVADKPSQQGYIHIVKTERGEEHVVGGDLQLVPEPMTNSPRRPPSFGDIHVHGPNSRVNVNSTDNSTNTVLSHDLFVEMRQTAQKIGDDNTRIEIIGSIDDLEKAQGQGGWVNAYQRFVAVAADHMTLFGPFLSPLMQIAMQHFPK